MNRIEDFIKFTSNGFSDTEEQIFSGKLANDADFRSDFKSFLLVRNTIENHIANNDLPVNAKVRFFSAVGLDYGTEQIPKGRLFSGSQKIVMTVLSLFVFACVIIIALIIPELSLKEEMVKRVAEGVRTPEGSLFSGNSFDKEIPVITSYQNEEKVNKPVQPFMNKECEINIKQVSSNSKPEDNSGKFISVQPEGKEILFGKSSINKTNYPDAEVKAMMGQPVPVITETIDVNTGNFPDNFSIQAAHSINRMQTEPTISPKDKLFYNNMSLALLYQLSDEFTAGIEVKAENFFLRFHDKNHFGTGYTYELQPNLTTYSALIRFFPLEIKSLKPYIQLSIGTNQAGYVSREIIGLSWAADENLSLFVNAGYSNLFYNRREGYFNSNNSGLQYGLIYNFK